MSKQLIDRQEQGRIIAELNDSVKRISETSYTVNSQFGNGSYMLTQMNPAGIAHVLTRC
jgi:hypothetical protein